MRGGVPSGSVARAALVLRQLAAARTPVSLTQIAQATMLPKSTVHRILARLVASGVAARTPAGHILSREWLELLRPFGSPGHGALRRLLTPHLMDLYLATGLACDLAVREDGDVLFLANVYGHDFQAVLSRLSARAPAHCTAAGQALLAFDPDGPDMPVDRPLAAVTDRTITDPGELQRKLARIRTCGVAVSYGERVPGMVGLAVPVTGRNGVPECALSVGGPVDRVEVRRVTYRLRRVALAASRSLMTPNRLP